MVLEWSRAETGVGATIAPRSQEEKGISAAFVIPANPIRTAGIRTTAASEEASTRARSIPPLVASVAARKMSATTKATPPRRFITRARKAFFVASSVSE